MKCSFKRGRQRERDTKSALQNAITRKCIFRKTQLLMHYHHCHHQYNDTFQKCIHCSRDCQPTISSGQSNNLALTYLPPTRVHSKFFGIERVWASLPPPPPPIPLHQSWSCITSCAWSFASSSLKRHRIFAHNPNKHKKCIIIASSLCSQPVVCSSFVL